MAKRFIGIDIDGQHVRVAVLEADRGASVLTTVAGRPCEEPGDLPAVVRELLGEPPAFGDKMATALPASTAFVRWLKFPFAESHKVNAALPLELGSQLPVDMEAFVTGFLAPQPEGDLFRVPAVAVRRKAVAELTSAFDGAGLPLQIVDLNPFALAAGLGEESKDALLIHLGDAETTLSLWRDGRPAGLRLLPGERPKGEDLLRESAALQRGDAAGLPLILVGPGAGEDLAGGLRAAGAEVVIPRREAAGQSVAPEFLPAVALAHRAAQDKERLLNFRRGPFALKSEWMALKRRLVAAGVLLALTVGAAGTAAWLDYASRARQAEALKSQMTRMFNATFPGTPVVVDVPLQMQAQIKDLEKRVSVIGTEGAQSPLAVLKEMSSRIPREVTVDLRDFSYGPDAVKIDGVTGSFEATNRMAKALEASPLFAQVQVTGAKMSLEGKEVEFRMTISLSEQQVRP